MIRHRVEIQGVVQGVGFRPHVYRLAHEFHLIGSVLNTASGVVVEVQGTHRAVAAFTDRVVTQAPPLARIRTVIATPIPVQAAATGFAILASETTPGQRTIVPPDTALCADCHAELFEPTDRRYRHPFITCTHCGPRFTIITGVPYDRPATSMGVFPLCDRCRIEYEDPMHRRFHAQPIACHDCGPTLWADTPAGMVTGTEPSLAAAIAALAAGQIVAVKGLGGYHLACRADDEAAVMRLRVRKGRPDKPLAIMARDLASAQNIIEIDSVTARYLSDPARPIVLAQARLGSSIAHAVAPGLMELGVMLPYTPLHHLLFTPQDTGAVEWSAVVMTSANISDEPLCYREDQLDQIRHLADVILGHTRQIVTPCDDSVVRIIEGEAVFIRRSRGYAPTPIPLPRRMPATFAAGAELKNTVCVVDADQAICSQHLGDMAGWESQQTLTSTAAHVMSLAKVSPTRWASDLHPGYHTTAWAQRFAAVPLYGIQHHRAHAASLLIDAQVADQACLVMSWDGTGYGDDGVSWGGEWLHVDADWIHRGQSALTRIASLADVPLLGGDHAVREPWRMALVQLASAEVTDHDDLPCSRHLDPSLREAWLRRVNRLLHRDGPDAQQGGRGIGPLGAATTSMGRLCDAVASLVGVRHQISYEGQAAIELEQCAVTAAQGDPMTWRGTDIIALAGGWRELRDSEDPRTHILDPAAMIRAVVESLRQGRPTAEMALGFHRWIAESAVQYALLVRDREGTQTVGLTGGVFANVVLTRLCTALLEHEGFRVLQHRVVPCNDGGLSLGQAVLAAAEEE